MQEQGRARCTLEWTIFPRATAADEEPLEGMRGNYRKQQGLSLGEIREVAARFPRAAVTGPAAAIVMGLPTLGWVEAVDLRYLSGRSRESNRRTRGWCIAVGA